MTKDVIEAILERRSVRKFKNEKVPAATVGRVLDAARWAPSAGNIQPWKIFVVYNAEKKQELATAALGQQPLIQAPVVLVITALPEEAASRYGQRGRELYAIQDTAAMVQNILLATNAYGLGSLWVGAFDEQTVIKALNLSEGQRPVAMIPIGYPDGEAKAPPRYSVDEIVTIIE